MSDPVSTTGGDRPVVQAHRGFAGVAPENTVLAARTAAEEFGVDWIEVDVQPTADGTVVCFHDPALGDRAGSRAVTDRTGLVRETPTEEVLSASVLDSGETVPRLSDLDAALPADVGLNIELKSQGAPVDDVPWLFDRDVRGDQRTRWTGFVRDVLAVLADSERPFVLSSFFEGAVAAAAEEASSIPRAVIVGTDLDEGRVIAERHEAEAVNVNANLLLDRGEPAVEAAHELDLAVNAWTVRDWTTARDLVAMGVDGLIADYPVLEETL